MLRGLRPDQLRALNYDWRFSARPNQLQPAGDWQFWLLLAGRGFGKTKTGGETVRQWARKKLPAPIHLIAPTTADIRDVMIEGPSGILSCYPPGEAPNYQPSKRHKLMWPNGNIAYGFSADEPQRLRGPQCLAGDTKVLFPDGTERDICNVRAGDFVQTRAGARLVSRAWMTSTAARVFCLRLVDGRSIIATGDHRICVTPALNGMDEHGTRNQEEATTKPGYFFIGKSGGPLTGQFQQDITFTTVTEISTIIGSRTSNCSAAANTIESTAGRSSTHTKKSPKQRPKRQHAGTERLESQRESSSARFVAGNIGVAQRDRQPIVREHASKSSGPEGSGENSGFAITAQCHIRQSSGCSYTADARATSRHAHRERSAATRLFALTVQPNLKPEEVMPGSAAGNAPWHSTMEIVSVEALNLHIPVYDLTVEGEHEFFANGILVHNCCAFWADELCAWRFAQDAWDNLMFGFRIGDNLRGCITTTPKPTRLLREIMSDPGTHVTRASTYDNRTNLAPKFFERIIRKYEGTRLGRQELLAEVLDDIPGALWTRAMIDNARVKLQDVRWDKVIRIVVAIDPAVTKGEESNETGIIVVALTRSHHLLVLDDGSCKETAKGWATIATNLFKQWKADRIVGEVNNGGDLVEANIRSVMPLAPFRQVRASKGKKKRFEPVSSLYEQGRVHHVGFFPDLETQMCEWTAIRSEEAEGDDDQEDDRIDALAWACHELVFDMEELSQKVQFGQGSGYRISPV